MDLSFKLANNSKLTINKWKKRPNNNFYFYCKIQDYKLDFCSKKQILVIFKVQENLLL